MSEACGALALDEREACNNEDQYEMRQLAATETCCLKDVQGSGAFTGAPFLSNEPARCETLDRFDVRATQQEPQFTAISETLCALFNCPIGIVAIIDREHTHVKAGSGIMQLQPTDRRWSFCTWTLVPLKHEALVVEDLSKDARFKSHPLVARQPYLRFYAASPLVSFDGTRLGTVCVIDYKPHPFSAEAANVLSNMAEIVMQEIEARSPVSTSIMPRLHRRARPGGRGSTPHAAMLLDTRERGWKVLYCTQGWPMPDSASCSSNNGSATTSTLVGGRFWEQYSTMYASSNSNEDTPCEQYRGFTRKGYSFQVVARHASGHLLCLDLRPANTARLSDDAVPIECSISHSTPGDPPAVAGLYFAVVLNDDVGKAQGEALGGAAARGGGGAAGSAEPGWHSTPFDDVELGPLLGQGSYGRVFLGRRHGAPVAIKLVSQAGPVAGSKRSRMDAAAAEAQVGMRLKHPHLVATLKYASAAMGLPEEGAAPAAAVAKRRRLAAWGFGSSGSDATAACVGSDCPSAASTRPGREAGASGAVIDEGGERQLWMVMEYCDGGTLQDAIDRGAFRSAGCAFEGGPDLGRALEVAAQVADALACLHAAGVTHGDLNPKNVMLCSVDGGPPLAKVSDFGLARDILTQGTCLTDTYGTVTHMPPELISAGRATPAVDVYSFGVLLWELYMGQRPHAGANMVQIVAQKLMGGGQLTLPESTPPAYRALAEACMAPAAADRPTFAQLLPRLRDLQAAHAEGRLHAPDFPVWPDPWPAQQAAIQAAKAGSGGGVAVAVGAEAGAGKVQEQAIAVLSDCGCSLLGC